MKTCFFEVNLRHWLINWKGNPHGFLMISLFDNCMIFDEFCDCSVFLQNRKYEF